MVRSAEGAEVEGAAEPGAGWHASGIDHVQARLGASDAGLSFREAAERLRRWGPNQLETRPPVSAWTILVAQFRSVVVLLLVLAADGAFLLGDRLEAAAIAAVLLVNTAIGFPVELRARRAMEALLQHQVHEATVVREGTPRRVPATELVPGDLIEVGEGEAVPADARLVDSSGVRTTEAALTGESVPVEKSAESAAEPDTPLAERANMVYAGTAVAVGTARALVVATGMNTELGRIGRLIESVADEETPLERRLDALGARLVRATLVVAVLLVGAGILRGFDPLLMVEMGIALAIAAVPEGLPVVATIALAIGLRRMARRNASVRRPSSVEALGSTTVVCTDKTGTLAAGEMTATVVVTANAEVAVTGSGYEAEGALEHEGTPIDPPEVPGLERLLLLGAALTARARIESDGEVIGDPTDAALVVLARKGGAADADVLARHPLLGEIPFTSESRLSASLHGEEPGGASDAAVAWIKGAPGAVLARCTTLEGVSGLEPLDDAGRKSLKYDRERRRAMIAELERLGDSYAAIERLFDWFVAQSEADPDRKGCLMVNTALELPNHPADVQEVVSASLEDFEAFFERTIRLGQERGQIRASLDPSQAAPWLLSQALGLRVLSRGALPLDRLQAIRDQALEAVSPG